MTRSTVLPGGILEARPRAPSLALSWLRDIKILASPFFVGIGCTVTATHRLAIFKLSLVVLEELLDFVVLFEPLHQILVRRPVDASNRLHRQFHHN